MNRLFTLLFKLSTLIILVQASVVIAFAEPFQTIINNGSPQNRVDIAILGDGYTAAQLAQYQIDVQNFMQSVFAQDPYREYQRYFNVHRIDVVSNQSGADHSNRNPPVFVDTAFDAAYNCAGIQRLICVNETKVYQAIDRSVPASYFDIILVMVNDTEYGGSGGDVAVASINQAAVELILHEVGHSFGLLADEYAGGGPSCNASVEPAEPNATKQTTRALIKWGAWISPSTPIPTTSSTAALPGLYEGSKYCDFGLYRPTFNSKMNTLGPPFEQINTEAHVKRVYDYVSPIDASLPAGTTVLLDSHQSQQFSVTPTVPFTHTLNVNWTIDAQSAGTGPTLTVNGGGLAGGPHTVKAVVSDPTTMVRSDPGQLLSESREWNLNVVVVDSNALFDYDGDGKTDVSVYRPSNGIWYLDRSQAGGYAIQFGNSTDRITPADFDGDRKTDEAVYRQSQGTWFIFNSSTSLATTTNFGIAEDVPAPGDYDGDGRADVAVYRPSTGTWWLNRSTAGLIAIQFGLTGDVPVPGDFDGDGKNDLVVYRPSNGIWYMLRSQAGEYAIQFGSAGDKIVPADYDGDGKIDVAIYRPSQGTWYTVNSSNGGYPVQVFGLATDTPAPGDYDGDGKADVAIFRPSNGQWWINRSTSGLTVVPFGLSGDTPTPNAFGN